MNRIKLLRTLKLMDDQGKYIFTINTLQKLFPEPSQTFKAALERHVKDGLLEHVCRGIYLNPFAKSKDSYPLEHAAELLRRGHYNYVSLESVLSAIGSISQVPLNYLTVMTTGRSQTFKTAYGTIEFTHTSKSTKELLKNIIKIPGYPLKQANKSTAIRDLKRVGRNMHLLLSEEND